MAYYMWRLRPVGMGHGPGLMLVPPLGLCLAHAGGVRQVMPPWPGSWVVPVPAPWCAYWCGAGCLGAVVLAMAVLPVESALFVIRWAAGLWRIC